MPGDPRTPHNGRNIPVGRDAPVGYLRDSAIDSSVKTSFHNSRLGWLCMTRIMVWFFGNNAPFSEEA